MISRSSGDRDFASEVLAIDNSRLLRNLLACTAKGVSTTVHCSGSTSNVTRQIWIVLSPYADLK